MMMEAGVCLAVCSDWRGESEEQRTPLSLLNSGMIMEIMPQHVLKGHVSAIVTKRLSLRLNVRHNYVDILR